VITARVALIIGLTFSVLTCAQEVKFVDLSGIEQRTTLRHPPAETHCSSDGSCVGGGIGGGSVGDGAPDRRDPHALGISLDRVSPTDITLDPFEADFRVINTGIVPIEIPVSPHLSDLQPPDETKAFTYPSLSLVINLDGIGPEQALGIGWIELYGSTDYKDSIVRLQPGQWVRVKSKVKLHTWPSKPVIAKFTADFWLRENVFTPVEGGGFTRSINQYPNRTSFPAITVRFAPTKGQP
jgi:hypothetical protein